MRKTIDTLVPIYELRYLERRLVNTLEWIETFKEAKELSEGRADVVTRELLEAIELVRPYAARKHKNDK